MSSVADEVQARAWDPKGNEVYASGILNIKVLNSSLSIQGPGAGPNIPWAACRGNLDSLQHGRGDITEYNPERRREEVHAQGAISRQVSENGSDIR